MKDFIITTDSTCDISLSYLKTKGVEVIPFYYEDRNGRYADEMDDITHHAFYQRNALGEKYKTYPISIKEYESFFLNLLTKCSNILHISISETVSESIINARLAASRIEENNQKAHIEVVDSLTASSGMGILIERALELKSQGVDLLKAYNELTSLAYKIHSVFTVESVSYLIKNNKLPKFSGFMGRLLGIKPILECGHNGAITVKTSVRGKKHLLNYFVNNIKKNVLDPENQTLYVSYSDEIKEAQELVDVVLKEISFKDYKINSISPIVGANTGPNLTSVFYVGINKE